MILFVVCVHTALLSRAKVAAEPSSIFRLLVHTVEASFVCFQYTFSAKILPWRHQEESHNSTVLSKLNYIVVSVNWDLLLQLILHSFQTKKNAKPHEGIVQSC